MKMQIYIHITFLAAFCNAIYGYENLAFRKPATMNGVFYSFRASFGNDGNKNNVPDMNVNKCSHTPTNKKEAFWQVDLGDIYPIKHIGIIYRQEWAKRFAGFSIFVSNTSAFKDGENCYHYSFDQLPELVKNWTCLATGRYVTIYNERKSSVSYPPSYDRYAILELCEVEVYGCPHNRFGPTCSDKCFCENITCDFETGICPGDCKDGYEGDNCNQCKERRYGDNCDIECGNCKSNMTCDATGNCPDGCEVGWQPPYCHRECENGHFGPACSQRCGVCFQGESCDSFNGSCINGCAAGYEGELCNKICEPGRFGFGCNGQCGQCKKYTNCDPATGHCVYGCVVGWKEPECKQVCPYGYYGSGCLHKCGSCENDDTCDHVTGICENGCKAGYLGKKCDKVCERGNHGYDCLNSCGNCYKDEPCNHDNGTCPNGCLPGWQSPLCIKCVPGYFGPDCVHRCGKCLNQEPCDQSTGECVNGCQDGWNGSHCEFKIVYNGIRTIYVTKNNILTMTISFVVSVLAVIGCIIMFIRNRRRQVKSDFKLTFSEVRKNYVDDKNENEIIDHDIFLGGRNENTYQKIDALNN